MKGLVCLLFAASLTSSANAAGAAEITQGNFDSLTKGKNSFVKFVRTRMNDIFEFAWYSYQKGRHHLLRI